MGQLYRVTQGPDLLCGGTSQALPEATVVFSSPPCPFFHVPFENFPEDSSFERVHAPKSLPWPEFLGNTTQDKKSLFFFLTCFYFILNENMLLS